MKIITWIFWSAVFLIAVLAGYILIGSASTSLPSAVAVRIPAGATLSETAQLLSNGGIIRSEFLFKLYATLLDGTTGVKTGQYLFNESESALRVAYRLVHGLEGFPKAKVTIPEGSTSKDIASIVEKTLPGVDALLLSALARKNEGYLFPETYFWATNATADEIVSDMKSMFTQKTGALEDEATSAGRSWKDVITMASLVEREASSTADRKLVAGILWKRLQEGMPLQADASFYYAIGVTNRALTASDLKMESPYNLYTHTGLPPTPIANPSLDSISAAIHPTASRYFYYLSGKDGAMHYAATLDQHIANKVKYL